RRPAEQIAGRGGSRGQPPHSNRPRVDGGVSRPAEGAARRCSRRRTEEPRERSRKSKEVARAHGAAAPSGAPCTSPIMMYAAIATDYDGTLACHGNVDEATAAGLVRARNAGIATILVTGRELADLFTTFPLPE